MAKGMKSGLTKLLKMPRSSITWQRNSALANSPISTLFEHMPSQEYKQYMGSPAWKQKSSFVKRKERCYVCGWDWKERRGRYLTAHHTRYRDAKGKSILGR